MLIAFWTVKSFGTKDVKRPSNWGTNWLLCHPCYNILYCNTIERHLRKEKSSQMSQNSGRKIEFLVNSFLENFQGGTVIRHNKNVPPGLREMGGKRWKNRIPKREKLIRSRSSPNLCPQISNKIRVCCYQTRICMRASPLGCHIF